MIKRSLQLMAFGHSYFVCALLAFAELPTGGRLDDNIVSIIYDPDSGDLFLDPASELLYHVRIDSSNLLLSYHSTLLCTSLLENCGPGTYFLTDPLGISAFVQRPFLPSGLSERFVASDLTALAATTEGKILDVVDLVYVPEPLPLPLLLSFLIPFAQSARRTLRQPSRSSPNTWIARSGN